VQPNNQFVTSYPDGLPADTFEKVIADLNAESFSSKDYAPADNVLVYSLFAAKKYYNSYRALNPTSISGTISISPEQGIATTARECWNHIDRINSERDQCIQATNALKENFPRVFHSFLFKFDHPVSFIRTVLNLELISYSDHPMWRIQLNNDPGSLRNRRKHITKPSHSRGSLDLIISVDWTT
jgi:hypothetical protein